MFYYKRGDIEVINPWERPSAISFESFLKDFKQIEGIQNYQIYVVGAFCENYYLGTQRETWDVDLILIGNVINYIELKNILNQSIEIGFRHNILIDIVWRDSLPNLNVFSSKKIITYTNAIQHTTDIKWSQVVEGNIKEILLGLYYVEFSPDKAYNKFIDKKYTLPYKKLEL
jgi:hypothetical protein